MTNFCKDCDYQDHESNLVRQDAGGWRCKFCNAHPKSENYFACMCGEWKESDVKQLYNRDKTECPECGVYLNPLPIIDGSPAIDHKEKVNSPVHYQSDKFEVIEIIEEFNLNFNLGNVIKYVLRSGKKENAKLDLEKARWYLSRQIDSIK